MIHYVLTKLEVIPCWFTWTWKVTNYGIRDCGAMSQKQWYHNLFYLIAKIIITNEGHKQWFVSLAQGLLGWHMLLTLSC